jgi:hypothetical protein
LWVTSWIWHVLAWYPQGGSRTKFKSLFYTAWEANAITSVRAATLFCCAFAAEMHILGKTFYHHVFRSMHGSREPRFAALNSSEKV